MVPCTPSMAVGPYIPQTCLNYIGYQLGLFIMPRDDTTLKLPLEEPLER